MRGRDQMYNTEVCAVEQAAKQGNVFDSPQQVTACWPYGTTSKF